MLLNLNQYFRNAYELIVTQAVGHRGRTNQEATNAGSSEELTEVGAKDHENAVSTSYGYTDNHEGEAGHEEDAYEESEHYADAQEFPHTAEDADSREEAHQVAHNEPESVLDVDDVHKGSADSELSEDQECDELYENEVSSGVEAASAITEPSTRVKESDPTSDAGHSVTTEARKLIAEGKSSISQGRSLNSFLPFFLVTCVAQNNSFPTSNSPDLVVTLMSNSWMV